MNQKNWRKVWKSLPKKKFVSKGNGKEKEKEPPGPAKPKSRPTKKSKREPNPDVKSQNVENFNKHSASNQECMSSLSEDETEEGDSCIFRNALYVDSKAREALIQCSGWQEGAHETCSKAEEEDDTFLCDFVLL